MRIGIMQTMKNFIVIDAVSFIICEEPSALNRINFIPVLLYAPLKK